MQFGDARLRNIFDPLNGVDVEALSRIAADLKGSKDKRRKAVGVFLDRVNRYRTEDVRAEGKASPSKTFNSSSGLQDLRD